MCITPSCPESGSMVNITPDQIAMLNVEDDEDPPPSRPIRGSNRNRSTEPEFEIAEFDPWEES